MAGVQIDGVNNKIDFDDDLDTSISANTDDTLVIEAGGNTMATITATTFTINDGTTITTADTSNTLTLKSTSAGASAGPRMVFERDSASPADSDQLGLIMYFADNDAGESTNFVEIKAFAEDVSNGTEDGQYTIDTMLAGSLRERVGFGPVATVFNDDSQDLDFRVESNGNTHMIFVDGGNDHVCIGTSTDFGGTLNVSGNGWFKNADNTDNLTLESTDADANNGPRLRLFRNSGSPVDNDVIGDIRWEGKDNGGNDVGYAKQSVTIHQEADGDEQSMMQFFVALGGSLINVLTLDRAGTIFNEDSNDIDFRVESNGNINMFKVDAGDNRTHFGGTAHNGSGLGVHNFYGGTTTDQPNIILSSNADAYADDQIHTGCMRTGTSAWFIARCRSGNASNDAFNDSEFTIRGDGNVFADGSFSGGGADYAEYFEWKDGNGSDEDRIGISVKLDGNKIVPSSDSDDASVIIGVISGNPAVVGDNDIDRWKQKYLKDDFGRYIFEDYTITRWTEIVVDGDDIEHSYATDRIPDGITAPSDATVISTEKNKYGETVNFFRKKTNSDWNKDTAYISREDRKEWDTVGLMGKLRMKKGQKTGTNWIKMRDISDTVEEWLVR